MKIKSKSSAGSNASMLVASKRTPSPEFFSRATSINLCDAGLSSDANAANALVTVEIVGGHKTFNAMCGNHDFDGDGYLDVTSDVKIGHLGLCP